MMMNFGFLKNQATLGRVKKLMIIIILVLSTAIGVSLLALGNTFNREESITNRQQEFRNLGAQFAAASDYLTAQARNYVQFGDKIYMNNYWREVYQTRTRDKVLTQLGKLRIPADEFALMEKAKSYSDALISTENAAMKAAQAGNFQKGRELMFDRHYNDQKMLIMDSVAKYQRDVDIRMAKQRQKIIQEQNYLIILINVLIFGAFAVVYSLLYLTKNRDYGKP